MYKMIPKIQSDYNYLALLNFIILIFVNLLLLFFITHHEMILINFKNLNYVICSQLFNKHYQNFD